MIGHEFPNIPDFGSGSFDPPMVLPPLGLGRGVVYLAGPITGLTYGDARYGWRQYVAERFNPGIRVLSPMRNEGHLAEIGTTLISDEILPGAGSRTIVEKDLFDINRCDVLFVNTIGAPGPVRGTLVEMGYARAKEKFIIYVYEPGTPSDYSFCKDVASLALTDLDEGIQAVNSLLADGV